MKNNLAREMLRSGWRCACAAVFASALIGNVFAAPPDVPLKSGFSADYTDTWWNPAQSGWGMQMVQTGSFIFATIYAYDAGGRAVWFGGGMTSNGGATFSGKLYVTTGPYYGVTFNPDFVTVREAGTMSFTPLNSDSGQLNYTIDGVTVTKAVQRQPLTLDDYNGVYAAVLTQTVTQCHDAARNGTDTQSIGVQITQSNGALQFDTANPAGDSCSFLGAYTQKGRNGRVDGNYTCFAGDSGKATMTEMNNHVRQFSTRFRLVSSDLGCVTDGYVTGIVPN